MLYTRRSMLAWRLVWCRWSLRWVATAAWALPTWRVSISVVLALRNQLARSNISKNSQDLPKNHGGLQESSWNRRRMSYSTAVVAAAAAFRHHRESCPQAVPQCLQCLQSRYLNVRSDHHAGQPVKSWQAQQEATDSAAYVFLQWSRSSPDPIHRCVNLHLPLQVVSTYP